MIVIIPLIILVGLMAWVIRPGKSSTRSQKIAILSTLILASLVAIAAVIFQLLHNAAGTIEVSSISNICFIIGLALIVVYILSAIGYALVHKRDIARGLGFGACIAILISVMELGLLEWLGGV
jgi:hypothetical protein